MGLIRLNRKRMDYKLKELGLTRDDLKKRLEVNDHEFYSMLKHGGNMDIILAVADALQCSIEEITKQVERRKPLELKVDAFDKLF